MCALLPTYKRTPAGGNSTTLAEIVRAARLLLSHGADATIATDEGWTPLHGLALHRDNDANSLAFDLANDLISRGADPNTRAPLPSPETRTFPRRSIRLGVIVCRR